jgi:hypothetical protein
VLQYKRLVLDVYGVLDTCKPLFRRDRLFHQIIPHKPRLGLITSDSTVSIQITCFCISECQFERTIQAALQSDPVQFITEESRYSGLLIWNQTLQTQDNEHWRPNKPASAKRRYRLSIARNVAILPLKIDAMGELHRIEGLSHSFRVERQTPSFRTKPSRIQ